MTATRLALIIGALCLPFAAAGWATCTAPTQPVKPAPQGVLAPLAPGLDGMPVLPAITESAFASPSEQITLEQVLLRLRLSKCFVDEFAGYVPQTQFDNTPYRFNMDAGKKFTAAEFEAWMKRRGVRIATGRSANSQPE